MMNNIDLNMDWMKETVTEMKFCNWLYKFICFCLGRRKKKLTYEELYVFFYGLYKKKYTEKEAKALAVSQILETYKFLHNNNLPKDIHYDE